MSKASTAPVSIFVSYSRADRRLVEPFVAALEKRGFDVWWDKKLRDLHWDTEIPTRLDASDWVIAFVTESAVNSKLDYVFVEMKRAREQDKLVPLHIGQYRLPFSFEAVISRIQTYTFDTFADVMQPQGFETVCRACEPTDYSVLSLPPEPENDPMRRVRQWFASDPSPELLAFAISLAVLEHAPLSQVRSAANDLARILRSFDERTSDTVVPGNGSNSR